MARLAPIVGIALLGACDPAPQADGPSRAALLQVGTAPTLTLSVRVAAPGDRITFDAAGLQPGARVALVYTDGYEVPDAGPCPPMLGGGCLDITTLSQLGSFRLPDADATGRSSISARVPAAVPVGAHAFQLVTHPAAGPWQEGGTASLEVLPASCFTVEPTDTGLSPSGYPDGDGDGVPDRCDTCPDGDDFADADVDGVADACDACPGALDSLDADGDGAPDACDRCPSGDDRLDDDTDGVPDACDVCPGFDDAADADLDTVADGCDPCPLDAPDDADGDGVCSTDEVTLYGTDPFLVDSDFDGLDDGTEVALGTDPNNPDSDADGIDDGVEVRIFESDPTDPTIRSRQPDFVIRGDVDGALTGASASLIPDLNGDGLDEFLIGAPSLDSQDGTDVGRLYVVYGTLDDTEVDLAQVLAGQGGFAVTGTDGGFDMVNTLCADPQVNLNNTVCTIVPPTVDAMPSTHDWVDGAGLGAWVTSLGDFDGDGVGDFAASSPWARVDGRPGGGKVHLFSGATAATTTLADLEAGVPASGGFVEGNQGLQFFTGANRAVSDPDFTGFGITGGFDLNGDGLADLAVQSPLGRLSDPEQLITIVLGKEGRVAGKVTDVAAPDGFQIEISSPSPEHYASFSNGITAVGDLNGDGFGDLIVNTYLYLTLSGLADQLLYVIYGGPSLDDLSMGSLPADRGVTVGQGLPTANGTVFGTVVLYDIGRDPFTAGRPLGGGGDVNGDGLADFVVTGIVPNHGDVEGAWVTFGRTDGAWPGADEIHNGAPGGFEIVGIHTDDPIGSSREGRHAVIVRDMNGDGLDEVALGYTHVSSPILADNGRVYVVYGKTDTAPVDLADVERGVGGFMIEGDHAGASLGEALDGSGDIDGDGLGDLIVGATDQFAGAGTGTLGVVRGGNFTFDILRTGGDGPDVFDGLETGETLVGGRGDDVLRGNGGPDVLYGGSGDDRFEVADASFRRVHGGTGFDTLALVGPGWTLAPATFRGRLFEVEAIDLSSPGRHVLDIARQDVLGLQQICNTLTVSGTAEDAVVLTGGTWTAGAADADGFVPWTSERATVRVQQGVDVRAGAAFARDPYTFAIDENPAVGDPIGQVAVIAGDVTYAVVEDPLGALSVDAGGMVRVLDPSVYDFEVRQEIVGRISAQTTGGVVTETRVFITLRDVNEPPVWPSALTELSVSEAAVDGTVVGSVTPIPVDPDADDTYTWSIAAGNDAGIFAIDARTGTLSVVDSLPLDFETTPQHVLTLQATDAGGAASTSPALTVQVTNVSIVQAPLDLLFTARQPLWRDETPSPNLDTLAPAFVTDHDPQAGEFGTPVIDVAFWVFRATVEMVGQVVFDWRSHHVPGALDVRVPVTANVSYPDSVTPGTSFDFTTTDTVGAGTLRVDAPTWTNTVFARFTRWGFGNMAFCAVTYCSHPNGSTFEFTAEGQKTVYSGGDVFSDIALPATANAIDTTVQRSIPQRGYDMSWVSYLNLALRAAGLPTNVGTFDFLPFGFGYEGYRFHYTLFEPIVSINHGVDYDFQVRVPRVGYQLTLENGTVLSGTLGTPLPITLPPDADTNQDGRVDYTLAIAPDASWHIRAHHRAGMTASGILGRISVEALNSAGFPIGWYSDGSFPGYTASTTLTAPVADFEETVPIATNTYTLRGSFEWVVGP